jgi:hypothetical protein
MATYLYCVRSDDREVPAGLQGIDGAAVRAIAAVGLVAWVSDAIGTSVDVTVERVRAHDAVCAVAVSVGETPLPIRFGQSFSDDDATVAAIDARRPSLEARLARVAGCIEMRIVVTSGSPAAEEPAVGEIDTPDASMPEGPGTAFLRRLARAGRADIAREVSCEDARHAVREAARALIVDQQPCETARGVSYFPVLVRREGLNEFLGAVTGILSSQAIDLSVLGPFAPYSFAGDG